MKCLVVGGAGFIGSHIVDALVKAGHHVRILDNFSTGKRENILHYGSHIEIMEGDIRHVPVVEAACENREIVFHEAAIASVSKSLQDPQATMDVNVSGTGNLLEASARAGVKHFIFASTAAVYGQHANLINIETDHVQPASHYGVSKLVCEQYGRFYSEFYEMQVTCLRYFNVYGSRQSSNSDYAGVITIFIDTLISGGVPKVFGDGQQTRDFINVSDVVQANLLAMANTDYRFGVFNIGTGQKTSIVELVEHLSKILGQPCQIQFLPERRGELRNSLADISLARKTLGYEPHILFYDGLQELVRFGQHRKMAQERSIQTGEGRADIAASYSAGVRRRP